MTKKEKKLGFAGKIASIFVMNSRLSILMIITLFAWGIFSFFITPKQYNPEIVAPAFQVITEFPGASSNEVQELLTTPLENIIMDIDGVDNIMSQSIEGGVSIVTVQFYVGESVEDSKIKMTQKINGNMDIRPVGVGQPLIKELNPDDVPVLALALSSDTLSKATLRKLALDIKSELAHVENTTNINVHGGARMQAKIILNPDELVAKNISILQISEILKQNNLRILSGDLEVSTKDVLVEVDSHIESIEDLKNMVVSANNGAVVYLNDVADIVYEEEDVSNFVKYIKKGEEEKNSVFISVAKKKGTNITQVTNSILDKLEVLKKTIIPESVKVDIVRNDGVTAGEEVSGLVINLMQAIVIVFFILLIFLGSSAASVVVIAIPLTLASVFGIGLLDGQTINRITLFALILSLGLLVDNATVVVENAVRHIEKAKKTGLSKKRAVIEAVDEVGSGLLMSTITTLFAFFPMAFVTGMMGPYMGPIPFFVPAALIVSLIIAFTINPYLSSVFLGRKKKKQNSKKISEVKKRFDARSSRFMIVYKSFLNKVFTSKKLRRKILVSSILIFFAVMLLPAFSIVKFRMLPKADKDQFYVYLDFPEGTLIEETNRVTKQVEDFLLKQKEVVSLQSFVGTPPILDFNGLFKGSDGRRNSNQSTIKVNITHHDNRDIKSEKLVQELRPQIYELLEAEPDVKVKLIEDPPGPPVLSTLLLKAKGNNYNVLKQISYDVEKMMYNTKGVVDIDTTRTENVQKVTLKIDYDKALRSGISADVAAYTLNIALSGMNVSPIHNDSNKEQEFVFMKFDKKDRNQIDDLKSIYLSNKNGEKIPLSEIVTVSKTSKEDVIYGDNRDNLVYIFAEMGARSVTYASIDMFKKMLNYKLPSGNGKVTKLSFFGVDYVDTKTGETYSLEWGGEWKLTVEVFRDLGAAMMVAVFLVYMVLVAQFHSFKTPFLIMGTIPLAMIGVLPGFAILGYITGIYFNATSMIGVIALAGIVVNNAIILVEYLNGLRGLGYSAKNALIEASVTRFRPIVLTSMTTILGSFTIVGDPVWAGLAWSIIFGISIATVLTLVVFPILYFTFEGKSWDKGENTESHGPTLE